MNSTQYLQVKAWDGKVTVRVRVAGQGPALVYLHSAAGPLWDDFLDRLAEQYTVYAPEFPGTTPDDPYAVKQLDDLQDVVLLYQEVIGKLQLERPVLVGQSFGGMLAAELASVFPQLPSRLVILNAIGLWRDDAPIANWNEVPAPDMPALLFHDPAIEVARKMFELPQDPEERVKAMAAGVWALGCTGKFVWPIADRGLNKRLHRIAVPSLIVWGEHDRLVPAVYADEFATRIAGSRVRMIANAGHIPQMENLEATLGATLDFLGEQAQ
ncbi:alpha/beta fold hydrolase [Pseudomonas sp. RIT623]|uniref:alpha/beta fold hydrolase n=1 Tax=Pseudomonas sp. RIT623 TaxID=2559075 RepID=UPI00106FCB57|nr:alpha/beta hydrolase [Pseudomonas sp. RIT623]TFF42585.1 alpha/beta hydrolase [Pseudomonas sp. RIT623]